MPAQRDAAADPAIVLPAAADAEHLTAEFRRTGVLGHGRVAGVVATPPLVKLRSHTFRLHLTYDSATAEAPTSIIFKTGHLDPAGRPSYPNRNEITFYRDIAPALPDGVVPRCFEAREATDTSTWHLLLEDLTETHVIATEWPLPPTFAQCQSMVAALARFHAAWWDHPRLGASVGSWPNPEAWDRTRQHLAEQLAQFTDRFGEALSPERRMLYKRLLDRAPGLSRIRARRDMTLIHGDAHTWNIFLPRPDIDDSARLFDWEAWSLGIATDDLAYMMAMLWYPDRRHRMEQPLLDRYHADLVRHGVRGYDRQALDDDYRLSVLWLVTRPVRQALNNIAPRVWWNNLERIWLAVDDLGCRALLE